MIQIKLFQYKCKNCMIQMEIISCKKNKTKQIKNLKSTKKWKHTLQMEKIEHTTLYLEWLAYALKKY